MIRSICWGWRDDLMWRIEFRSQVICYLRVKGFLHKTSLHPVDSTVFWTWSSARLRTLILSFLFQSGNGLSGIQSQSSIDASPLQDQLSCRAAHAHLLSNLGNLFFFYLCVGSFDLCTVAAIRSDFAIIKPWNGSRSITPAVLQENFVQLHEFQKRLWVWCRRFVFPSSCNLENGKNRSMTSRSLSEPKSTWLKNLHVNNCRLT